jgi:MFS transporter, PPP family, 3-phenylpropionic acid transporter
VIAVRLVVLALGVAMGAFYPFIGVILADLGFGPGEIGLIASVGAIGFTLAVPAWGHLADVRFGRPRTLRVCAVGGALAIGALLVPWPGIVVAILFTVFWIFESAWQPLADAITVNAIRGRDYARVRLLTSFSFATATIVTGFIYDRTGYALAFAIFALAAVGMAVATLWVPDIERADLAAHAPPRAGSPGRRRRRLPTWSFGSTGVALQVAPRLALVLAAVALLHVGIIVSFTFLGLRIVELGGSPSDVALASGGGAALEIPAMLVAATVARRIGLRGMFVGSALIYAAGLATWAAVDVPWVVIATRASTGIAFAGVVVGVVLTIARLLPAELQATGQALYQTTAFGMAAIVANVIGGALYDVLGHAAVFGFGAAAALAAAALGWFAFPFDGRAERRAQPSQTAASPGSRPSSSSGTLESRIGRPPGSSSGLDPRLTTTSTPPGRSKRSTSSGAGSQASPSPRNPGWSRRRWIAAR